MIFINAVVNAADDISLRFSLRQELYDAGFQQILIGLRNGSFDNELMAQLVFFEDEAKNDLDYVSESTPMPLPDMNNPEAILRTLMENNNYDGGSTWLLKTLRELLILPFGKKRSKILHIIYQFVHEITVKQADPTPDVSSALLKIDQWVKNLESQPAEDVGLAKKVDDLERALASKVKELRELERNFLVKQDLLREKDTLVERLKDDLGQVETIHRNSVSIVKSKDKEIKKLKGESSNESIFPLPAYCTPSGFQIDLHKVAKPADFEGISVLVINHYQKIINNALLSFSDYSSQPLNIPTQASSNPSGSVDKPVRPQTPPTLSNLLGLKKSPSKAMSAPTSPPPPPPPSNTNASAVAPPPPPGSIVPQPPGPGAPSAPSVKCKHIFIYGFLYSL